MSQFASLSVGCKGLEPSFSSKPDMGTEIPTGTKGAHHTNGHSNGYHAPDNGQSAYNRTRPKTYLDRGWSVMPVSSSVGKKPDVKWKRYQTELPDAATVTRWFNHQFPGANIGFITGALSGFFVVETDSQDAHDWLTQQVLPPHPIARSSGDYKLHHYFKHPGFRVKTGQSEIYPNVDVRGDGGYVVGAPSVHHTGVVYKWLVSPDAVEFPDAPDWLLEAIIQNSRPEHDPGVPPVEPIPVTDPNADRLRKYAIAALNGEVQKVATAPDGQKHTQVRNSAISLGTLVPHGLLDAQKIEGHLFGAIADRAKDKRNALSTIKDGIRYGSMLPRDLPQSKAAPPCTDKKTGSQSTSEPEKEKKKSQADTLIEIGLRAELFGTPDDEPHATIERDGHRETHRLKSSSFRDYLKSRHFQETGKAPSAQATQDALDTLAGFAYESGIRHTTHLRVASTPDAIYLDLGDDKWRAVEITAQGWKVVEQVPVKFIRARGVLALPEPQRGGSIKDLRNYINIGSDDDFRLLVGWELAAFQPHGALPILNINGPQGSAKSVTSRHARQLIDPNATPTRSMPRNSRDLMIAAKNSETASFDNVSTVEDWLSDAMCSLSTGAGFATRELHSDGEEILITAKRRAILNGITGTGDRADFLDRCIILTLPRISDSARRLESEVEGGFRAAHGAILGAILDAVSVGLKRLPETKIPELPRMADFAVWATACETGFGWEPGSFIKAYKANLKEGVEVAADASPIVAALRSYIGQYKEFEGTTAKLSEAINEHVGEAICKRKDFPSGAQSLGHALKRAATVLLTVGVEATCRKTDIGKVWTIKQIPNNAPNPDDVPDDVPKNDDVEPTSSATSSAEQAHASNSKTPESQKPDNPDDVEHDYSSSVFRRQKNEEGKAETQKAAEEHSGFSSSGLSASSFNNENETDDEAEGTW